MVARGKEDGRDLRVVAGRPAIRGQRLEGSVPGNQGHCGLGVIGPDGEVAVLRGDTRIRGHVDHPRSLLQRGLERIEVPLRDEGGVGIRDGRNERDEGRRSCWQARTNHDELLDELRGTITRAKFASRKGITKFAVAAHHRPAVCSAERDSRDTVCVFRRPAYRLAGPAPRAFDRFGRGQSTTTKFPNGGCLTLTRNCRKSPSEAPIAEAPRSRSAL